MSGGFEKTQQQITEELEVARKYITKEIFETEKNYNTYINRFEKEFLTPLQEKLKNDKNMKKEEKEEIQKFINMAHKILPIIELSNQMFAEIQASIDKKSFDNAAVILIFNKYMPFFKMVTEYVKGYNDLLKSWEKIEVYELTKELSKSFSSKSNGLDVKDHLIMPIQRGPRYKLLLEDLLKKTPKTDASYDSLEKVVNITKSIIGTINELKKNAEWQKTLDNAHHAGYDSVENKNLRSVEFSKFDLFFKLSLIDNKKLKELLSTKFKPEANLIITKSNLSKREYIVTIVLKNDNTGQETPFKFKVLKGNAGETTGGKDKAKAFHIKIEHDVINLPIEMQNKLYEAAEKIGNIVIDSMIEQQNTQDFRVLNPIKSNQSQPLVRAEQKMSVKPSPITASLNVTTVSSSQIKDKERAAQNKVEAINHQEELKKQEDNNDKKKIEEEKKKNEALKLIQNSINNKVEEFNVFLEKSIPDIKHLGIDNKTVLEYKKNLNNVAKSLAAFKTNMKSQLEMLSITPDLLQLENVEEAINKREKEILDMIFSIINTKTKEYNNFKHLSSINYSQLSSKDAYEYRKAFLKYIKEIKKLEENLRSNFSELKEKPKEVHGIYEAVSHLEAKFIGENLKYYTNKFKQPEKPTDDEINDAKFLLGTLYEHNYNNDDTYENQVNALRTQISEVESQRKLKRFQDKLGSNLGAQEDSLKGDTIRKLYYKICYEKDKIKAKTQMLARKNDIEFLQAVINKITNGAESNKAECLLGAIELIKEEMKKHKGEFDSMGMGNFQMMLEELEKPLLTIHSNIEKSKEDFRNFLIKNKDEFEKFDLTSGVLASGRSLKLDDN